MGLAVVGVLATGCQPYACGFEYSGEPHERYDTDSRSIMDDPEAWLVDVEDVVTVELAKPLRETRRAALDPETGTSTATLYTWLGWVDVPALDLALNGIPILLSAPRAEDGVPAARHLAVTHDDPPLVIVATLPADGPSTGFVIAGDWQAAW